MDTTWLQRARRIYYLWPRFCIGLVVQICDVTPLRAYEILMLFDSSPPLPPSLGLSSPTSKMGMLGGVDGRCRP